MIHVLLCSVRSFTCVKVQIQHCANSQLSWSRSFKVNDTQDLCSLKHIVLLLIIGVFHRTFIWFWIIFMSLFNTLQLNISINIIIIISVFVVGSELYWVNLLGICNKSCMFFPNSAFPGHMGSSGQFSLVYGFQSCGFHWL